MTFRNSLALALVTCCAYLLAGCGGGSPETVAMLAPPPAPPTTLAGTWLLTSQLPLSSGIDTSLSATLVVSGTQVSGIGFLQIKCPATQFAAATVLLNGSLASDGSFTMTNAAPIPLPTQEQITISGASPSSTSPTSWTGKYVVTPVLDAPTGATSCPFTEYADFTASALTPPNGTYTGPALPNPLMSPTIGANAGFSLQLSEGSPIPVPAAQPGAFAPDAPVEYIPITAALQVTGSPCFTSGSADTQHGFNYVSGSTFTLFFTMNDGSYVSVLGFVQDASASLVEFGYRVSGGSCAGASGSSKLTHS